MLVSIIIPVYNRADLIEETLVGIISQTYTHWECIVVDDGSSDNTIEIVQNYSIKDSRISIFSRPDGYKSGANGARNYGFRLAKGEYICWFDSDDIMEESYLEKHLKSFISYPYLELSVCYAKVFEGDKVNIVGETVPYINQLDENIIENIIKYKITFPTPCCVWRKSFLNNKDLFNENLFNAQESEFNFKRCAEGAVFSFIADFLVYIRRGHSSIISTNHIDYKKIQSQYDYYNFVYKYIKDDNNLFLKKIKPKGDKKDYLLKYCIHRKLSFFSLVRNRTFFFKKIDFTNALDLIHNVKYIKISHFLKLKTIIGIVLIFLFNKGFIFIKEFKQNLK